PISPDGRFALFTQMKTAGVDSAFRRFDIALNQFGRGAARGAGAVFCAEGQAEIAALTACQQTECQYAYTQARCAAFISAQRLIVPAHAFDVLACCRRAPRPMSRENVAPLDRHALRPFERGFGAQ
ncbi:hypothetical protein LCGC14_2014760, partial [marine sediment metagenome]